MSSSDLNKSYSEAEEGYENRLPPWSECNFSQKSLCILLHLLIYIPVIVLWILCLSLYLIFLVYYLIPNVQYTSSRPAIYYWHSSSEYYKAKLKAWSLFALLSVSLFFLLWSEVRAMTTDPGTVPRAWTTCSELQGENERRRDGNERICIRCEMKKPDRTHHCRQCEKCTLRMDHHCNWIANCVGYWNYKYFMCMLVNSVVCSGIFTGSFWETVAVVLNDGESDMWFCFGIVLCYSISCMVFAVMVLFTGFHFLIIWTNYTTIEYCEKRKKNYEAFKKSPYSLGAYQNFKQALGRNPATWFIPTEFEADGDGINFINCNS